MLIARSVTLQPPRSQHEWSGDGVALAAKDGTVRPLRPARVLVGRG